MGSSFTDTSQNEGYNYNHTNNYNHNNTAWYGEYDHVKVDFIIHVVTCIIISISLPLILMAIYSLYSLVRKDNVAPIYVINLLISDLLQLCCMIVKEALHYLENPHEDWQIHSAFLYIHIYGVVVSVGFMVCIALERYLLIAHPLWYRFRRTIKISVVVCVLVWVLLPVPFLPLQIFAPIGPYLVAIFLLLPFPLFIFFLGGTLKALSASISVSPEEKRRIFGILFLVLLIYTLLFLPNIINLCSPLNKRTILSDLSFMLIKLSPLADLVLYIFMRKGAIDKLLASLCCCRMDSNDVSNP